MPKKQAPLETLNKYLPAGSYEPVLYFINLYKVHLTITRDRSSILGNYRSPHLQHSHRITINGGLNKFSFLITFIHELAHLVAFEKYRNRIEPHGKEWQQTYKELLEQFLLLNIFPPELVVAIKKSQRNPAASSCAEIHLTRALARFDDNTDGLVFVEQVNTGASFTTSDGRVFIKGEKRRTRHFGTEKESGKIYLFSGIYRVKPVTDNDKD
jgi:hypothetical protein